MGFAAASIRAEVRDEQADRREAGQATPREVPPKAHNDEQPASPSPSFHPGLDALAAVTVPSAATQQAVSPPTEWQRVVAEAIDDDSIIKFGIGYSDEQKAAIAAVLAAEKVVDPAKMAERSDLSAVVTQRNVALGKVDDLREELDVESSARIDLEQQLAALRQKVEEAEPKLAYAVGVFQKINEKFWLDWIAEGAPEGSKEERRDYLLGGISHAEEALAALRSTGGSE